MTISPIVAAAIGGALGGGLGALVGFVVSRFTPQSWHKIINIACAAGFAVVGGRLGAAYGEQQAASPSAIEAQLSADPDMSALANAWRRADPASYQAFIARISAGMAAHQDQNDLINQTRTNVIAEATQRLPHMDDAHMSEFIHLTADEFRALQTAKPEVCVAMLRGQPFGDIRSYIGPALVHRDIAMLVGAFDADVKVAPAVMSAAESSVATTKIVDDLRAKFGDDVALLGPQANTAGKEARVCEIGAAFYDDMAAIPGTDGPRLMRSLMAPH